MAYQSANVNVAGTMKVKPTVDIGCVRGTFGRYENLDLHVYIYRRVETFVTADAIEWQLKYWLICSVAPGTNVHILSKVVRWRAHMLLKSRPVLS